MGLGDQDRTDLADDPLRLPQYDLDHRVLVPRAAQSLGELRRFDIVEFDGATSAFETILDVMTTMSRSQAVHRSPARGIDDLGRDVVAGAISGSPSTPNDLVEPRHRCPVHSLNLSDVGVRHGRTVPDRPTWGDGRTLPHHESSPRSSTPRRGTPSRASTFTDITYHRAVDARRGARSRSTGPRCATPSARTPSTSSTARSTTPGMTTDVGVRAAHRQRPVARRTAAGRSAPAATSASAAATATSTPRARPPTPSTRPAPGACTSSRCSG